MIDPERSTRTRGGRIAVASDLRKRLAKEAAEGKVDQIVVTDEVVVALATGFSKEDIEAMASLATSVQISPRWAKGQLQVVFRVSRDQPPDLWTSLVQSLRRGSKEHTLTKRSYEKTYGLVQAGAGDQWELFGTVLSGDLPSEMAGSELVRELCERMGINGRVFDDDLGVLQVYGLCCWSQLEHGTQEELKGEGFDPRGMWQMAVGG